MFHLCGTVHTLEFCAVLLGEPLEPRRIMVEPRAQIRARRHVRQPGPHSFVRLRNAPRPQAIDQHALLAGLVGEDPALPTVQSDLHSSIRPQNDVGHKECTLQELVWLT